MAAAGVAGDKIPAVAAGASTVNRLLHRVRAAVASRPAVVAALCLSSLLPGLAQYSTVTYLSREDATPIFAALEEPLPPADEWGSWIAARDRATRARVTEGDETTIVNWLLFGTSFTREPRIVPLTDVRSADLSRALSRRIDDLVRALDRDHEGTKSRRPNHEGTKARRPNHEDTTARRPDHEDTTARNGEPALAERIEFARQVVGSGDTARRRLMAALERVSKEQEVLAGRDREARELGDSRLEFAERSRIYRDRGLATDTSLRSSFAIDEALRQLARDRGINAPIQRVAIVGPGVDFADKQAGHDAYPPQTIQPFAVQDSLLRLGLARAGALEVIALDLNDRVNAHISHAVSRSKAGQPYAIRLLVPASFAWTREFANYWQTFGNQIGRTEAASGTGEFKVRTIQVTPSLVRAVSASDVNVTAQRLELERAALFDLVIATNIFVYYDRLQQGLAAVSLSRMLRPDGFLLSNNAIVELPAVGLQSVGYSKTLNSDNPEDGDLVIWYRKVR